jgi:uncharacterized protein (TIGR02594 family)
MSALIVEPTLLQHDACENFLRASKQWLGQREVRGEADNPFILECIALVAKPWWAKAGMLHDETAWCSAFIHRVLKECHYEGTGSAAARSFLRWGERIATPIRGCIAVYSREAFPPVPGSGHVALWMGRLGENPDIPGSGMDLVRGGNQTNGVTNATRAVRRSLGYFVPTIEMIEKARTAS